MAGVRVTLVKISAATGGGSPVGQRFEARGRAGQTLDELRREAFGRLQRSMPDENPMCWEEEEATDGEG